MKKLVVSFLYLSVIMVVMSCGQHSKLLKSSDNELKYEAAIAYFNDKNYYKALQLFEQLMVVYRGTSRAEKITYYTAHCYYEQDDYILAEYFFTRFARSFPTSNLTEEATYLAAYCTYLQSPNSSLDQAKTYEALEMFAKFINRYPMSDKREECKKYIDELHGKLELKSFNIAKLYLKTSEFEAAVYAFNNLIQEYPNTVYEEEALYNVVLAYNKYAEKSITEKKKERYQEAIDAYNALIVVYPESTFRESAEQMHSNAVYFIKNN